MATPLTNMRKALDTGVFRQLAKEIGSDLDHTWAVYVEYHQNDMTWEVSEIVPWYERGPGDGDPRQPPFKVTDAKDELDAYKKFMEQTNG